MAAELEFAVEESASLFQSSGGVFEIQYKDQLIFSKKATGRFPADGEILRILSHLTGGMSLEQAQAEASRGIPAAPSFMEWLAANWKKHADKAHN